MSKGSIIAIVAAAAALSAPAYAADKLSAHLGGAGSADTDGAGHASFTIDSAKNEICYQLMVENIQPATMAHIHVGAAGVSGGVAVPLAKPDATGKSSGCATVAPDVVKAILADPAGYYVNVHNAEHPAGAIRGQLSK
ncbi:MAG: CHRD domain-containing protein [Phenylobacterium sp.]|nr:CHRD domain-containing protein [Phenylobacterium sp.]